MSNTTIYEQTEIKVPLKNNLISLEKHIKNNIYTAPKLFSVSNFFCIELFIKDHERQWEFNKIIEFLSEKKGQFIMAAKIQARKLKYYQQNKIISLKIYFKDEMDAFIFKLFC